MEYMFDCADLAIIRRMAAVYPYTGVTTNPSIFKGQGPVPFFGRLKEIRSVIGTQRSLHVQVTAADADGMLAEAHAIRRYVDDKVYIKVPVTEEGLAAITRLKAEGFGVTATSIYNRVQGFLAIACKADYIAPYCNRMAENDIDFRASIAAFRQVIDQGAYGTRILAASFHSMEQVNDALLAGADAATVDPALLHKALTAGQIVQGVAGFKADWQAVRGDVRIDQLDR